MHGVGARRWPQSVAVCTTLALNVSTLTAHRSTHPLPQRATTEAAAASSRPARPLCCARTSRCHARLHMRAPPAARWEAAHVARPLEMCSGYTNCTPWQAFALPRQDESREAKQLHACRAAAGACVLLPWAFACGGCVFIVLLCSEEQGGPRPRIWDNKAAASSEERARDERPRPAVDLIKGGDKSERGKAQEGVRACCKRREAGRPRAHSQD